jgi:hypothetical protein
VNEFRLAASLSMTVTRLRREMSQAEYVHWLAYHEREAQLREIQQGG